MSAYLVSGIGCTEENKEMVPNLEVYSRRDRYYLQNGSTNIHITISTLQATVERNLIEVRDSERAPPRKGQLWSRVWAGAAVGQLVCQAWDRAGGPGAQGPGSATGHAAGEAAQTG